MGEIKGVLITALLIFFASPVLAIDHKNLDENRPLQVQDAYAISQGELALETGAAFSSPRRGHNRLIFPVSALYGAWPNGQVEIGTRLYTYPGQEEGPGKSGDLALSALHNFNQETLTVPAFGLEGSVEFPTGVDSSGVDFELTGLMTKSFERLSLHLNAGYEFLGDKGGGRRDGRYTFVVGASYPLGAPRYTRLVLLADFYLEQSAQKEESDHLGGEIGLRYQWTERTVLDFGLGREFSGPSDRTSFQAVAGISIAF